MKKEKILVFAAVFIALSLSVFGADDPREGIAGGWQGDIEIEYDSSPVPPSNLGASWDEAIADQDSYTDPFFYDKMPPEYYTKMNYDWIQYANPKLRYAMLDYTKVNYALVDHKRVNREKYLKDFKISYAERGYTLQVLGDVVYGKGFIQNSKRAMVTLVQQGPQDASGKPTFVPYYPDSTGFIFDDDKITLQAPDSIGNFPIPLQADSVTLKTQYSENVQVGNIKFTGDLSYHQNKPYVRRGDYCTIEGVEINPAIHQEPDVPADKIYDGTEVYLGGASPAANEDSWISFAADGRSISAKTTFRIDLAFYPYNKVFEGMRDTDLVEAYFDYSSLMTAVQASPLPHKVQLVQTDTRSWSLIQSGKVFIIANGERLRSKLPCSDDVDEDATSYPMHILFKNPQGRSIEDLGQDSRIVIYDRYNLMYIEEFLF